MLEELPQSHDRQNLEGILEQLAWGRNLGRFEFGIAYDVGAHIGTWTGRLADKFSRVVAFEPHPRNFEKLKRQYVKHPRIFTRNVALAETPALRMFMSDGPENTGQAHLDPDGAERVAVSTLDVVGGVPDFIKLDVEGMELRVLQGGVQMIERHRPAIMVELNGLAERYGNTDQDVIDWLTARDYKRKGQWNKDHLFAVW